MIVETVDIRFECNKCGQHLVVEAAAAGLTADCPICNTTVTVPRSEAKTAPVVHMAKAAPYADPPPAELRDELIDASLLNGKLVRDLEKTREENTRLQQQLKTVGEEFEHLNASTTHSQAELKTFQGERQQLKAELSSLRQRFHAAEEKVAGRDQELQAASQAIEAGRMAATTAEHTLAGERAERERITGELATHLQHLQEWQAHAASQEEDLHKTRARLGEIEASLLIAQEKGRQLDTQRGDLQKQLEDAQAKLVEAGDLKGLLARTSAELNDHREKLRLSEESNQSLTAAGDQLRKDVEGLRRDLNETHAGRELLVTREQLDVMTADRDRNASRLSAAEADLKAFATSEEALKLELAQTKQARDEAITKAEEFCETRVSKDNEVLRGIVSRQNAELAQKTGEIFKLKRARAGLKAAYVAFGIGLLAVVALAIRILPHALH